MEYQAVILGLLVYTLYVVLPLIPAILIYKMFPSTTVGATGILGNLKINATGAFAAYLITVVLGHFVIEKTLGFIDSRIPWEITSHVKFINSRDSLIFGITDEDIKNKLEIKTTPDYTAKNLSGIVFMAYGKEALPKVTFSYPGFESQMIDLEKDSIKKDFPNRKIDLGIIILRRSDQVYDPQQ